MTPSTEELEAEEELQASGLNAPASQPTPHSVHLPPRRLPPGERRDWAVASTKGFHRV